MNPLTDELSDDAKAELAALFAELRLWYPPVCNTPIAMTMHLMRRQR